MPFRAVGTTRCASSTISQDLPVGKMLSWGAALWPVIQGGGNHIKAPQCIAFEENVLVKPYKSTALLNWISSLETMAIKPTVGAVWGNV